MVADVTNLEQLERFHRDAADQFRPTADLLPVLIWTAGTDKLCTWFNKTWLSFVGRTMEHELGNGWADNVHPEDFDRCLETYVASFDARMPFRMEYRLKRYDDEYHWVLDEGRPLYHDDGAFAGYLGCCLLITEQKEALQRERRVAETLQSAFLPPFLPNVDGIEFQAFYRPAERDAKVGGDWYDAFVLADGRVALSIGDIFGHGLEAAGEMIRLRETLRAVAGFVKDDPGAIMQSADRAFQAHHPGAIASAVFAVYDPSTRLLRTANAGHPQPAIVRAGTATTLPAGDVLLGVSPDSGFGVHETQLESGDSLVLYTDGLIEADRDAIAGERCLMQKLVDGPLDVVDLVASLTATGQQDDVAVLVFSIIS
ncbi:MAG: SpoIIE family protein phosphatase [Vulcanimicrobiaceae bacterium]